MSDDKKRDRALQRRVRERMAKTGESYQAAWQQLADQKDPEDPEPLFLRSSTGLPPLDNVLGGGLVSGSVVLFAGPVGSGRTTLTLQVLKGLGHRCLYVTSEETREHVAATAQRVGAASDQISLMAERNVAKILAYAQEVQAKTIAIDTIQKIFCADIGPGSAKQLVECVNRLVDYAKTNDTAIWIVGHVTSAGAIAGPTAIEHSVDVVLTIELGAYFEGRERIVSCAGKNRFGPSNVVGCFELTAEGFVPVDGDKIPEAPHDRPFMVRVNPQLFDGTIRILGSAREVPSRRFPLSLSTGVRILPGQSAQVTARPQLDSFWPDRLLIKNAKHWDIHQLTIGWDKKSRTSLIELGCCPASEFALDVWHPISTREVTCGEEIVAVVTYRGPDEHGEPFEAALFGGEDKPVKSTDHRDGAGSERFSERAESKDVRPTEMAEVRLVITAPELFVDRLVIKNAKEGDINAWLVHDILVRGESIFVQAGDIPGEMFTDSATIILERLVAGDDVEIEATYIGLEKSARLDVELSGTATPSTRPVSYFLPMTTGVPILPAQSAQIIGRTHVRFLPERIVMADPDDWIVNDIKAGVNSQLAGNGDIPAQAFSGRTVGGHVTLDPVRKGKDFVVAVTRSGDCEWKAPFFCGVQGRRL